MRCWTVLTLQTITFGFQRMSKITRDFSQKWITLQERELGAEKRFCPASVMLFSVEFAIQSTTLNFASGWISNCDWLVRPMAGQMLICLLYTSDAADDL